MRVVWILFSLCLGVGCANHSLHGDENLSLSHVVRLKVDNTNSAEVVKNLGEPKTKDMTNTQETWTYINPNTHEQRLVLTFSDSPRILKSILWIPLAEEPENDLKNVILRFPNLKIELRDEAKINPHSPIEDITYRDEATGQVVLASGGRSKVVALAWYSRNVRDVTGSSDNKKKQFNIGK